MKILHVDQITKAIADLSQEANFELPLDILMKLKQGVAQEGEGVAKEILHDIVENARIAREVIE